MVSTVDLAKLKNLEKWRAMLKKMVVSLELSKNEGPIWQAEDKDDDFFDGMRLNSDEDPDYWENADTKMKKHALPGDPFRKDIAKP